MSCLSLDHPDIVPTLSCSVCGKALTAYNIKETSPGRIMHKDENVEDEFAGSYVSRATVIVCPAHQAEFEDEGYYAGYWWDEDGIIHGSETSMINTISTKGDKE